MNDSDKVYEVRKAVESELQRLTDEESRSIHVKHDKRFLNKLLGLLRGEK